MCSVQIQPPPIPTLAHIYGKTQLQAEGTVVQPTEARLPRTEQKDPRSPGSATRGEEPQQPGRETRAQRPTAPFSKSGRAGGFGSCRRSQVLSPLSLQSQHLSSGEERGQRRPSTGEGKVRQSLLQDSLQGKTRSARYSTHQPPRFFAKPGTAAPGIESRSRGWSPHPARATAQVGSWSSARPGYALGSRLQARRSLPLCEQLLRISLGPPVCGGAWPQRAQPMEKGRCRELEQLRVWTLLGAPAAIQERLLARTGRAWKPGERTAPWPDSRFSHESSPGTEGLALALANHITGSMRWQNKPRGAVSRGGEGRHQHGRATSASCTSPGPPQPGAVATDPLSWPGSAAGNSPRPRPVSYHEKERQKGQGSGDRDEIMLR